MDIREKIQLQINMTESKITDYEKHVQQNLENIKSHMAYLNPRCMVHLDGYSKRIVEDQAELDRLYEIKKMLVHFLAD